MKKALFCCIIAAAILMMSVPASAAFSASFSLTGPSSARPGNSVTVAFKADGNGICGILAEITYDTDMLTYSSSSGALKNWRVEVNGGDGKLQIWAEENNSFKSPINSQSTVIELKFRLASGASAGDKTVVKADIEQASDGNDELSGLSASYSLTVARPLSTDSSLESLSVDGYTLKPSFSRSNTKYEIDGDVEYTKTALRINASAFDGEASVEISGARLSVGDNTVRVKVTAEDGSHTTTYTIKARMKQDPDYVASSVATLSSISLSDGRLSPPFSPDVTDYIVYVPYEVENMTAKGEPSDRKASSESVSQELVPGENRLTLICTAEDGTASEYTITVVRMPQYPPDTTEADETETGTAADTETETETDTDTETEPPDDTSDIVDTSYDTITDEETEQTDTDNRIGPDDTEDGGFIKTMTKSIPFWIVIAAAAGGIVIGAAGSLLVLRSLKERK